MAERRVDRYGREFAWGSDYRLREGGGLVYLGTRAKSGFENLDDRLVEPPREEGRWDLLGFDPDRPYYDVTEYLDPVTNKTVRLYSRSLQDGAVEFRYEVDGDLVYWVYPLAWNKFVTE
jgi:hypothetical protein